MIDVKRTIISQYANSPTIFGLIEYMDGYLDPRADFDAFYDSVWNIETASGFGLDIWGRIVGVSRYLTLPDVGPTFGFSEAGDEPFGDYSFAPLEVATTTYLLGDDAYRQLILVKALANISQATAPAINRLLQILFVGRGRCYVNDLGNMQLRYTFEFELTDFEMAVITESGVFPRPAGVESNMLATEIYFGFSEAGDEPFGDAPFISETATHAIV